MISRGKKQKTQHQSKAMCICMYAHSYVFVLKMRKLVCMNITVKNEVESLEQVNWDRWYRDILCKKI